MSFKIYRQGIFDTVQDEGRKGYRHLGINPGGAMDLFSSRLANALLGKSLSAPVIEMSFPAAQVLFEKATVICLAGAHFHPVANNLPIPLYQPVFLPAGTLLQFMQPEEGKWCYLALIHELQLEPWLQSFSTNARIHTGGWLGRPLHKDDRIPYANECHFRVKDPHQVEIMHWGIHERVESPEHSIHFIQGPECDWLSPEVLRQLTCCRFRISVQSDRMGYRLEGGTMCVHTTGQMISSAVSAGTIQLLPNGQLIVLMADHQTTGGYPRIGQVTSTDLSRLAQLPTGSFVQFEPQSLAEAETALVAEHHYLEDVRVASQFKMQNILYAPM